MMDTGNDNFRIFHYTRENKGRHVASVIIVIFDLGRSYTIYLCV